MSYKFLTNSYFLIFQISAFFLRKLEFKVKIQISDLRVRILNLLSDYIFLKISRIWA